MRKDQHHQDHEHRDGRPATPPTAQAVQAVHVAHAPIPDDKTATPAAYRAFEAVLRICTCPESALLVYRRPGGRVEALEHHHTDPTCPVVLAAGHPELERTP